MWTLYASGWAIFALWLWLWGLPIHRAMLWALIWPLLILQALWNCVTDILMRRQ